MASSDKPTHPRRFNSLWMENKHQNQHPSTTIQMFTRIQLLIQMLSYYNTKSWIYKINYTIAKQLYQILDRMIHFQIDHQHKSVFQVDHSTPFKLNIRTRIIVSRHYLLSTIHQQLMTWRHMGEGRERGKPPLFTRLLRNSGNEVLQGIPTITAASTFFLPD